MYLFIAEEKSGLDRWTCLFVFAGVPFILFLLWAFIMDTHDKKHPETIKKKPFKKEIEAENHKFDISIFRGYSSDTPPIAIVELLAISRNLDGGAVAYHVSDYFNKTTQEAELIVSKARLKQKRYASRLYSNPKKKMLW